MAKRSPSKQRLEELIALARTYRGWSSKDLARELGRDVHHLVPDSGVPKLDIVIALADALDWTVQDVVDDLCGNVPNGAESAPANSFDDLNRAAWEALQAGEYTRAAAIAQQAFAAARNGNERAIACVRESGAWDGLGRYLAAMECCQRGLQEPERSSEITLALRNNLGFCHYLLGNAEESIGITTRAITDIERGECESRVLDASEGFARYVRGATVRAILSEGGTATPAQIQRAIDDLSGGATLLRAAGERLSTQTHIEVASICDGARLAVEILAGRVDAEHGMKRYLDFVEAAVPPSGAADRVRSESLGWWCVFACEVALRAVSDAAKRDQLVAIFTTTADEIAATVDNWALRERVWRIEIQWHLQNPRLADADPWVIDADDARELSGAMARFPKFRKLGWRAFRTAQIEGGR